MLLFGEALPGIRKRVDVDLALRGLPREKVLAAIVRLVETTYIRVGNEEYAKTNKSHGLTTMRNRHVKVRGSKIQFHFEGNQAYLAEVSGLGKIYISQLENGRKQACIRSIETLAISFEMTVSDFLKGV